MKRYLNSQQALQRLATLMANSVWSHSNRTITGTLQGRSLKGRDFPTGPCIAMTVDMTVAQLSHACLLLAATAEACDDALYIERDQLWLLRRYPVLMTEVELDLLLQQQHVMASLLVPAPPLALPSRPIIGRFA